MINKGEIDAAQARVKAGRDLPRFHKELKGLGILRYAFQVEDGSTVYHGKHGDTYPAPPLYEPIEVAVVASKEEMLQALHGFFRGRNDLMTFCQQMAHAGIARWVANLKIMQVVYQDGGEYEMYSDRLAGDS